MVERPRQRSDAHGAAAPSLHLPPGLAIGAGVALLAFGWLLLGLQSEGFGVKGALACAAALLTGAHLLIGGIGERRQLALESHELERARTEQDQLRLWIQAELAGRSDVDMMLRERGYSTTAARVWIERECWPRGER